MFTIGQVLAVRAKNRDFNVVSMDKESNLTQLFYYMKERKKLKSYIFKENLQKPNMAPK